MSRKQILGSPGSQRARRIDAVIVVIGVALALGFLPYTRERGAAAGINEEVNFKVWQLLVTLQFVVWSGVAFINTRNYRAIRNRGLSARPPWRLLVAVYTVLGMILIPAQMLGVVAPRGSHFGLPGLILQIVGVIAAAPAFLSLDLVQGMATNAALWTRPKAALDLTRFLRRRVRPAVGSIGAAIGLAIIVTSQIVSVGAPNAEERQPLVLLYGGFFTTILFVAYLWVNAAIDARSRAIIEDLTRSLDPADKGQFEKDEKYRATLEAAFGIGRSTRESFEDLVAVASPLIAALTTIYIG